MATTDTEVQNLIVNKLTLDQYKTAKTAGTLSATEAYEITDIDTAIDAKSLPSQSGQSGKYLTTDGTNASWATVSGSGGTWGTITGTLSDQTDLQTALNAAVHKTGDETVAGLKTYTNRYLQKNTALTKGTLPASANWWSNEYTDKNGSGLNNRLACMEYAISTNGDAYTHLRTYKYASNNSDNATLSIVYPITGNPYATAPTPTTTTSTDSTQIATTGWVNKVGNNVIHKTGDETFTGKKTFARAIDQSATTWTPMIPIQDTNTDFTVNPSYSKDYYLIQMTDKNGKLNSWITSQYSTNGESATYINVRARNTANTGNVDGSIGIIAKRDGTIVTKSHTPATSDNSTQIATTAFVKAQGYLTSHQSLSNYVTLNGNQTISGTKTFTANQIISGASKILQIKNTNVTRNTAPSANVNTIVVNGLDSAGKNLWGLYNTWTTGKANEIQLLAYKGSTTDNTYTSIGVGYDTSGNPFTRAPTPATSDNSTKIATTAYVNNKHVVVSTLPASPDANVFYYIPE